ncbi:malonyl-CoA decarboxylase [Litoreibacter roseus]|uniref:Malonyl-CoA decarboxylase n=1 Tax=Litoreibacter roseus TaxID=2601869 RepID=A0A6N6JBA4_9RHOB|nr:malonyl-CoA decarboxylase [Litoreibacter roseus]GFE63416.1 hypothetical protein KIN_04900 [Litoreibacter roseus]
MNVLGDLLSTLFERRARETARGRAPDASFAEMAEELLSTRGEVTGMVLAEDILTRYETLSLDEKLQFFRYLVHDMDISADAVRDTLNAYQGAQSKATYRAFMQAAEPRRQELVRRLNQLPGATARLVRMRADLLGFLPDNAELAALDLDFRHLFASWFNRGFLVLRAITWASAADVLEKIIAYEAVHAIDSWDDLRRRLKPADRRCFAFFHPAMPGEPLIFVEVALTKGVPGSIADVLSADRASIEAHEADTAVFYSISNCQAGLAGVSFGNSLIKQVAGDLAADLPGLGTFVTLSPIPGLLKWMASESLEASSEDHERVRKLAAYYLLNAKRDDGLPVDPVARFHLGNGALVHAVHAGADPSEKGRAQSLGAMVNYAYDLANVSKNHERFAVDHEVVAAPTVRQLSQMGSKEAA